MLIVEDDYATREMYEYALRMAGLNVVIAADGFAALRVIDQEVPDVIVLDLDLPHVSGIDVHAEVMAHAETRITPVIVVTGTEWQVPQSVFRSGNAGAVAKGRTAEWRSPPHIGGGAQFAPSLIEDHD